MKGDQLFTVYLTDDRCGEDESFAVIHVASAAELGKYLHGVYKISKAMADAYAQVAMAGVHLMLPVSKEQLVTLSVKDQKRVVTLPLRHAVLHPSGKTYQQRLEEDAIEREIAAYAAVRRASAGTGRRS
ncbi:hypothetical protein [Deinococcus kurensis]|uniref:hypothetical protein n=1 Tax=Deinococcus kurensis TaxID=2662757 RepID=UPI0012D2D477|nr:hypothetical protein [Deinococcus kurensis]